MNRYLTDQDYELLSAYIDGELSAPERGALEQRLKSDPALQAELDSLRAMTDLIGTLPPVTAPRDFTLTADMVSRRAAPNRIIRFTTSPIFSTLSAAAAVFLLLAGSLLLVSQPTPPVPALGPAALSAPPSVVASLPTATALLTATPAATSAPPGALMAQPTPDATGTPQPESIDDAAGQRQVVQPTALAFESIPSDAAGAAASDIADSAPDMAEEAPAAEAETSALDESAELAAPPPVTPVEIPRQIITPPAAVIAGFVLIGLGLVLLAWALLTLVLRRRRR